MRSSDDRGVNFKMSNNAYLATYISTAYILTMHICWKIFVSGAIWGADGRLDGGGHSTKVETSKRQNKSGPGLHSEKVLDNQFTVSTSEIHDTYNKFTKMRSRVRRIRFKEIHFLEIEILIEILYTHLGDSFNNLNNLNHLNPNFPSFLPSDKRHFLPFKL